MGEFIEPRRHESEGEHTIVARALDLGTGVFAVVCTGMVLLGEAGYRLVDRIRHPH
jgi:hypothetical protein